MLRFTSLHFLLAMVMALSTGLTHRATAAEPAESPEAIVASSDPDAENDKEPSFSVGMGLAYQAGGFIIYGGLGSLAMGGPRMPAPAGALTAEFRIDDMLWFTLEGRGGYMDSRDQHSAEGEDAENTHSATTYGNGTAGLRIVLTEDLPVEVSLLTGLGVSHYSTRSPDRDYDALSVDASVGLALATKLTDNISLRISARLLEGGWSSYSETRTWPPFGLSSAQEEETESTKGEGWNVRMPLDPMLSLHYTF